jgi:hypothetical protein
MLLRWAEGTCNGEILEKYLRNAQQSLMLEIDGH